MPAFNRTTTSTAARCLSKTPLHLAIETIGRTASLAAFRGEELILDVNLGVEPAPFPPHESKPATATSSRKTDRETSTSSVRPAARLATALDQVLGDLQSKLPSTNIEFVSVASGPGSFTGLRVGVTTAKVLCYAKGWPLVAVNSLAAMAASIGSESWDACLVGLNAFRRQVYAGRFRRCDLLPTDTVPTSVDPTMNASEEQFRKEITRTEVVSRQQWHDWRDQIEQKKEVAGPSIVLSDIEPASPLPSVALGVGRIGLRMARREMYADAMSLAPNYFRPSAAEEKAKLKQPEP